MEPDSEAWYDDDIKKNNEAAVWFDDDPLRGAAEVAK